MGAFLLSGKVTVIIIGSKSSTLPVEVLKFTSKAFSEESSISLSDGPCRSSCYCRLAGEQDLLSDHQALWSMLRSRNNIWWADNLNRKAPSGSVALFMHSYASLHSLPVFFTYGLTPYAGFDPKTSQNVG